MAASCVYKNCENSYALSRPLHDSAAALLENSVQEIGAELFDFLYRHIEFDGHLFERETPYQTVEVLAFSFGELHRMGSQKEVVY
jgi:hypothetical protein